MLPVFDDQLAQHLGLEALQVGAGPVGQAGRPSAPRVLAWWSVSVEPSFDRSWAVGALHEEVWTGGPDPEAVTARGFVADADGAAVAPLAADEGLAALGRLDPFRVAPTHRTKMLNRDVWVEMTTLDGLGYRVRWGSQATEGQFRFSNPNAGWLVDVERVLFGFARRVVLASGVGRFEDQLQCWAEYREPLRDV
jgi:hypothetical protein